MWAQVIAHITKDNWLGGVNYYGDPVSTIFLLMAGIVLTPVFIIKAWLDLKAIFTKPADKPKTRSKTSRRMQRKKR